MEERVWLVTFNLIDEGFNDYQKQEIKFLSKKDIDQVVQNMKGCLPAGVKMIYRTVQKNILNAEIN